MSLRVAIDATPLLGARTGVGAFVAGALPALADPEAGLDLDLRAFGLTWNGRRALAPLLPPGVEAVRAPMAAGPLLRAWARADEPAVEWWTGEVDVVHGTNFVVPPSRRGAEVVTVHDLTSVRYPQLCAPTSLAYPRLVRRALGRGAWVHTPSAFVAGEVVDILGADPDRVRVVAHGVPGLDLIPPEPPAQGDDRYILAVGTAEPRKDLPGLVRAFDAVAARHPDVHLVLIGARGWGEEDLAAAVATAHHRTRITRLGYVDDRRRAALVGAATVLAFPSVYEGFGLPPLEAMAAGVPVVATRAGAVPEVVGDAGWLVGTGDTDALAAALAGVLDLGDGERAAAVERGRRRAACFSWERCARGLSRLYRDAA
jgi:glycosyltransferase involved in cell wall biosynthesis